MSPCRSTIGIVRSKSTVVENQVAALWTIRDGKPARCEMFAQREKALEAARMSDQEARGA